MHHVAGLFRLQGMHSFSGTRQRTLGALLKVRLRCQLSSWPAQTALLALSSPAAQLWVCAHVPTV